MMRAAPAWMVALLTATLLVTPLAGCSGGERSAAKGDDAALEQTLNKGEQYRSSDVQGVAARINLDEVRKAFESTKGKDMNTWMGAFEKRVNEIYDGSETVAIDAARNDGKLVVAGFIDKNGTAGFQKGDERLFAIEQTGVVANNQVPYQVSNGNGQPYYQGSSGFGGMGSFMMGMMAGQMLSNWGGYHTPRSHYGDLSSHRDAYRGTPDYKSQVKENKAFASRYKVKAAGTGLESNRKFGDGGATQSGTKRRSWGGTTTGAGTTDSTGSGWGGRRRTTTVDSNPSSGSGWGNRRRSSTSSRRRR